MILKKILIIKIKIGVVEKRGKELLLNLIHISLIQKEKVFKYKYKKICNNQWWKMKIDLKNPKIDNLLNSQ